MSLYDTLLNNKKYLNTVKKIEKIKFITNGKWDWEHGLEHYKRVAAYIKDILTQLKANERTIDLAMTCALVHDIGLSKGNAKYGAKVIWDLAGIMDEKCADDSFTNARTSMLANGTIFATICTPDITTNFIKDLTENKGIENDCLNNFSIFNNIINCM